MGQRHLWFFLNKIFSARLSAFRKRYSCQSTLLIMIEYFKKSLDSGEYVARLSMDLSKAFDCLPHCLTICKLHSYGASREACTLITSYLRGHKRIKLGNTRGEWVELLKSVRQGSKLGSLIFNIFSKWYTTYFISYLTGSYIIRPMIAVSESLIQVSACSVPCLRMKPRLWLNGLRTILWKQTRINSKELYYPGAVTIHLFRFQWGCRHCVCSENKCSWCQYWRET